MKKLYKTLTLSSLAMVMTAAPLVAVVSCGGDDSIHIDYLNDETTLPVAQTSFSADGAMDIDPAVISTAKAFLTAGGASYDKLTLENLKAITPAQQQEYSISGTVEGEDEVSETLDQLQTFLLDLFYANNNNEAFNAGVAKYLNNASLSVAGIGGTRGPWITDRSRGGSPAYINPAFHKVANADGDTSLQDSTVSGSQKKFVTYNSIAGTALQSRVGDPAAANGNTFSSIEGIATGLPLIRTKTVDTESFNGTAWTGTKTFTQKLEGAESISIGNGTTNAVDAQTDLSNAAVATALNDSSNDTITFNIKTGTKYIKASGANGDAVKTNFELKGRDFFLGFVHQLYTDVNIRTKGLTDAHGTMVLPPLTESELNAMKAEYAEAYADYVNYNMYLYDLYNIDIAETVKANEALSETDRATKFVVKFETGKPITPTGLQFFTDSNVAAPVSSDFLKTIPGQTSATITKPGEYFGVTTYFPINQNGSKFNDVSSWLSVSPYYYTQFDITPATGQIAIRKNPFYMDTTFASATNSITDYQIKMKSTTTDQASWATQRKDAFLRGDELVLDPEAQTVKTVTDAIVAAQPTYKTIVKPFTQGYMGNITWNPFGYAAGYNDLGRKLMFGGKGDGVGNGTVESVKNDSDAFTGFVSGNGAEVRAIIASAINWYTVAQGFFPGQNKTYWQSVFGPELSVAAGKTVDQAGGNFVKPSYTDTTSDLQKIYNQNLASTSNALLTSKTLDAAKKLDALAASVGATDSNPAVIPYQIYEFNDASTADVVALTDKLIMEQLNKLTPKVKFTFQVSQSWSDYVNTSRIAKTGVSLMHSFGKDYDGIGSIAQQYMANYVSNVGYDFVFEILSAK